MAQQTVSFGSFTGGDHTAYPPPTTFSTFVMWPLGYYQRLTTGAGETYDVYFDTASPPTHEIFQGITLPTCNPGTLAKDTTYYWQVVAHSGLGPAPSPVWQFTTAPPRRPPCAMSPPETPATR